MIQLTFIVNDTPRKIKLCPCLKVKDILTMLKAQPEENMYLNNVTKLHREKSISDYGIITSDILYVH